MKTVPVRELSQNGASKIIAAAEKEPVLITRSNEPAVWMVSAREVARASAELTGSESVYADVLAVVAVDLYDRGVISIGRAARFAGKPLVEFIALCSRWQVPVLREPPGGLPAELAGLEAALDGWRPTATRSDTLQEAVPVPRSTRQSVRVTALTAVDKDGRLAAGEANPDEYLMTPACLVV